MNKLQLYITKSGNVFKSLFNLNPNEDVRRNLRDLSDAIALIDYDVDEKNIFYLLSATDDGMFFVILRTIPPHRQHHLAAWIYIPNDTDISGHQLLDLVNLTTRKVSSAEVTNDDVAALREAFSIEYPTIADAPLLTGCRGDKFAWRNYGEGTGYSLADFTGDGRWQQSYVKFAGVLLTDNDFGYTVDAERIDRIPLGEPAVIEVPEKSDNGFTAYVFDRSLDHPLRATLGAELVVSWRRQGFEDIVVETVVNDRNFVPEPVSTQGSQKLITPDSFFITSQVTRDQLRNCSIRVNGKEITAAGRKFTSDELHNASVLISCEGYFPYSGQLDLAATARALIQLQERRKIYRFEIPLVSSEYGAPVRFELQTKAPITESPLEGYIPLDEIQEGATRTNRLGYTGVGTPLSTKLVYAAVGLAVGIVLMLLLGTCTGGSTHESNLAPAANPDSVVPVAKPVVTAPQTPPAAEEQKPEAKPAQTAAAPVPTAADSKLTVADAVKYLDDNTKWDRNELEKNPATRGLFDDMNNFNRQQIIDKWGPVLKDSKRFTKLVGHVKGGMKKAKLDGTFNKPGDNIITVQSYLNRVDP